jgi:TRAP-type mannitol/chloroaromatic compound transport system substrate-binding protein
MDDHGVKLRKMPAEIMAEIARLSIEVVEEAGQHDELSGRIYESFSKARTSSASWSEISEEAFWQARRLPTDAG